MTYDFTCPTDLAERLAALRLEHDLPGLAWAAAPQGGELLAGASGARRVDHPDALSVHDPLHLGSCTKPMTATMLATLVPDVLSWDTRVADVLPSGAVHPAYHDVTLTDLLSHHSGLPPFEEDHQFDGAPTEGTTRERRDAFARWALTFDPVGPRGAYAYSNAGFGVAAVLAEHVTGRSWEDLMRERVFAPLALDGAGFGWPALARPDGPWGHQREGERWAPHDPTGTYHLHAGITPAGDVHMNILEFATFARAHLRGLRGTPGVLDVETFRRLHTPVEPGGRSGLGWGVSTYRERRASSHSGSADTFLALLLVLPDEGYAFVVVTNAAGEAADAGTRAALAQLVSEFTSARVGS
ncbi:serine hydrolase domain-containing protein [Deinococcus pimensis]|uniref:serine hydrolase domain-containing protein n=1 Tax=Deinococcus pimensis TaxID=309888 RepID=UPI000485348B|nr:serine hydrolase domain-containing protein [Deinococcus pimensis]